MNQNHEYSAMKLSLCAVGRLKKGPETELYQRYGDRIVNSGKAVGIGPLKLLEIAEANGGTSQIRRSLEADKLIDLSQSSDYCIALDEGGKSLTSREFSGLLGNARDDGYQMMSFLIGGADGHGDQIKQHARMSLTLGRMTLPHGLARVVLVEQIYRAITIMSGHPYHRD